MHPRKFRLKAKLRQHINDNQACYLAQHGKLAKIHVRHVKPPEGRIVDYLFKYIRR